MWIQHPRGFFSAVQKNGDTNLTIRARCRADLEALQEILPGYEIVTGAGTDYFYRLSDVPHEEWARALAVMTDEITYSNFKNEITRVQGRKRHDIYSKVWTAFLSIEDPEAKKSLTGGRW